MIMRVLPKWLHPVFTNIIPQRWGLRNGIKEARTIVDEVMSRHEEANEKRAQGVKVDEEDCMLNWVLDNADLEKVNDILPQIVLAMFAPAAHTTAMAISNVLFDLCAHPEWAEKLQIEAAGVIEDFGPVGQKLPVREWTGKLELLDSFFLESQRMSQPIMSESPIEFQPIQLNYFMIHTYHCSHPQPICASKCQIPRWPDDTQRRVNRVCSCSQPD